MRASGCTVQTRALLAAIRGRFGIDGAGAKLFIGHEGRVAVGVRRAVRRRGGGADVGICGVAMRHDVDGQSAVSEQFVTASSDRNIRKRRECAGRSHACTSDMVGGSRSDISAGFGRILTGSLVFFPVMVGKSGVYSGAGEV